MVMEKQKALCFYHTKLRILLALEQEKKEEMKKKKKWRRRREVVFRPRRGREGCVV